MTLEGYIPPDLPDNLKARLVTAYKFTNSTHETLSEAGSEIAMLALPVGFFVEGPIHVETFGQAMEWYRQTVENEQKLIQKIQEVSKKKIYEVYDEQNKTNSWNLEEMCLNAEDVKEILTDSEGKEQSDA